MNVENNALFLAVAVVLLVFLPYTSVRATDERKFNDSLAEVTHPEDGARQANWILSSEMSDEKKVAALRELLHTGMSIREVAAILGSPQLKFYPDRGVLAWASYHQESGNSSVVWVAYDSNGKARTIEHFNISSRQSLTIASKSPH